MRQLDLATSWGPLRLVGGSRAGEATLLLLPQLRLALDAGRPARALVPMQHVLVSHGHLDHLLGLAAWAGQRQLQGIPGGTVYAAASLAPGLSELLALHARLEGGSPYDVTVEPVGAGDEVELRGGVTLSFFSAAHWVDTLGGRLDWSRRRLRPEFAGQSEDELRERREAGEEITENVMTTILAYLADTGPEVFATHPWMADAEVLVVECTFLRPNDRERARRFGHMHLEDLIEVAPTLRNRHLVLTHLSRRHRIPAGAQRIRRALEPLLDGSLHLLNVEWE